MKKPDHTFLLNIKLIDSKDKALSVHKIEAWEYDGILMLLHFLEIMSCV